jgi:hypothetical protein
VSVCMSSSHGLVIGNIICVQFCHGLEKDGGKGRGMYLSERLLVGDCVYGGGGLVAAFELVGDELRAEGFDHEVVVVEG